MAPDFTSIRRFADALDAVLYDGSFDVQIDFFYDADIVINMILGFRQFHEGRVLLTDAEYLVQALLSSGMFGKMHMLRPHALELDEKLRYQPDYRRPEGQELFRAQVNDFLNEPSINGAVEDLYAIVQDDSDDDSRRARFLETMRRLGPSAFVAIEFVKGTWKQRLRRYWDKKQLIFESMTPEMQVLFNTDEFRTVAGALAEERPSRYTANSPVIAVSAHADRRPAYRGTAAFIALETIAERRPAVSSVNNTRDAAALAALAYLMHGGRQVRFYTQTRPLRQVLTKNVEIRSMFSNPIEKERPGSDMARCIVRDESYLLVRAYMEALTESKRTAEEKSVIREEIEWVARQLRFLMNTRPRDVDSALAGLRIADRRISEIIRDIETLAFLQTVLRREEFGEAVGELHEWTDVWAFARGLLETDALEEQILNITDELRQRVSTLKTWFERQERVEEASRNLRERWRGSIYPHAMRDLGLIRWGVNIDKGTDERIRTLVGSILTPDDEQKSALTSGSIVSAIADAPGNDADVVVVCAVLWLLELFDLAFDVLTRHAMTYSDSEVVPDSFRIWRVAAALRSNTVDRRESERLFAELDEHLKDVHSDPTREAVLLGLGFVRFFAWRVGIRSSAKSSLEATGAAARNDRSITSAFAVNQYAYIGTMSKIERDKTENALNRLRHFRSSDHWHYRFADTLAYSDMQKAEQLLDRGKLTNQERLLIRAQLSTAHDLLSTIVNTFGDSEIDEHILLFDQIYKRALENHVVIDLAPIRPLARDIVR